MTAAAPIIALADAVTDFLNDAPAGTFSQEFAAERVYQRPDDSENARGGAYDTLKVYVIPAAVEDTPIARDRRVAGTFDIIVLVIKHLDGGQDADPKAEMDELASFVVELSDYLRLNVITDSTAKWQGSQIDPVFSPEALNVRSQFSSSLIVTYLQHRP